MAAAAAVAINLIAYRAAQDGRISIPAFTIITTASLGAVVILLERAAEVWLKSG